RRLCPCWRRRSCARARLAQELLRRGRVSTQARARARGATVGYVAERRHRRQRIERRAGSRLPSPATCDGQRAREIEPDVASRGVRDRDIGPTLPVDGLLAWGVRAVRLEGRAATSAARNRAVSAGDARVVRAGDA